MTSTQPSGRPDAAASAIAFLADGASSTSVRPLSGAAVCAGAGSGAEGLAPPVSPSPTSAAELFRQAEAAAQQQAAAVTLQCTARKMLAKSVVKGLKADEFEKLKEEDRQRFEDDEKTFTLDLTRARASSSSPDNTSPSSSEGRAKRPSISERVASFRPFAMKGSKARASAGRRTMEAPPTASPRGSR